MRTPLPIRFISYLLATLRFPSLTLGFGVFAVLFLMYFVGAVVIAGPELNVWTTERGRLGFAIVVSVLPAFLFMCLVAATRLNQNVYTKLLSQLKSTDASPLELDRYQLGRFWPLTIPFGVFLSLPSISWSDLYFDIDSAGFMESISILTGTFFIWTSVVLVPFFFLLEGYEYHKLGKQVPIDLYNLDKLNGFGRISLGGFLLIMSSLALSTLQSIDQEFSWQRYGNVLATGLPSAVVLVMLPSWSVHRRIRRKKSRHLEEITAEINRTPTLLSGDALMRMNGLLARKSAIQAVRTWPMDLSIFSRFVLY
ncbi:MAG: hypothetical protein ACI8V0_003141, partial [Pseudohongiellaceae bacterium]